VNPDLVTQLRDINGLDTIPWWPLATGWWLLAALFIALVFALISLLRNLRHYPAGSWHRDAWKQLRDLRQRASSMPVEQLAADLSELLRRIAVARLGRDRAAGLTGERWLGCLQKHDPAGFAWTRWGKPLLALPYAPSGTRQEYREQLVPLIDAALVWTDKRESPRHV
jgi:hypothetical protein